MPGQWVFFNNNNNNFIPYTYEINHRADHNYTRCSRAQGGDINHEQPLANNKPTAVTLVFIVF